MLGTCRPFGYVCELIATGRSSVGSAGRSGIIGPEEGLELGTSARAYDSAKTKVRPMCWRTVSGQNPRCQDDLAQLNRGVPDSVDVSRGQWLAAPRPEL